MSTIQLRRDKNVIIRNLHPSYLIQGYTLSTRRIACQTKNVYIFHAVFKINAFAYFIK